MTPPRVLDRNLVITKAQKMLSQMVGEKDEVAAELTPRLRQVKVDPGQIEQARCHLVSNARDAILNGGRILVRTRNPTFTEGLPRSSADLPVGAYVVPEVSDTGMG